MRTGKLAISRGHRLPDPRHLAVVAAESVPAPAPVPGPVAEPAPPPAPDYQRVHDRLAALGRLTQLYEQGALTADEFIDEKALILGRSVGGHAGPVHFVPAAPRRPQPGPSLVGRMLSWQFLLLSVVVGLAFSFATQPDTTLRFFNQIFRALGG